jgi:hypothetical protein
MEETVQQPEIVVEPVVETQQDEQPLQPYHENLWQKWLNRLAFRHFHA